MLTLEEIYSSTVLEKDEHKKSRQYKKLAPKMKVAIDQIFGIMDSKPSDFLNTFEKTIQDVSKKFKVSEKELMNYFEKEMLSIQEWSVAVVLQTLVDSDFEHVVKVTTSGTSSVASIADASALNGASTDPRLSIAAIKWSGDKYLAVQIL